MSKIDAHAQWMEKHKRDVYIHHWCVDKNLVYQGEWVFVHCKYSMSALLNEIQAVMPLLLWEVKVSQEQTYSEQLVKCVCCTTSTCSGRYKSCVFSRVLCVKMTRGCGDCIFLFKQKVIRIKQLLLSISFGRVKVVKVAICLQIQRAYSLHTV